MFLRLILVYSEIYKVGITAKLISTVEQNYLKKSRFICF